jgi:hypothetical protein
LELVGDIPAGNLVPHDGWEVCLCLVWRGMEALCRSEKMELLKKQWRK